MTDGVEMIVARDADPGVRTCACAWADCLRASGLDVESADITEASATATLVIVAPHAALRPIADDSVSVAGLLRRAVCISTSRLGSGALGADQPYHRAASGSLALSRDTSRYLSAHGIATAHLKPGGHARLRSADAFQRSVAVGAHARYSAFREDLLARSRHVLDPYPCDLRIAHGAADRPAGHLNETEWLLWLTGIDVLVSLPTEAGPGTDWCELAPAVMNGSVVLTTAESDFGPLQPGEDVAVATAPGFADALRRLLVDDERRGRMRASALAHLSDAKLDVTPLLDSIAAVGEHARRARPLVLTGSAEASSVSSARFEAPDAAGAADAARRRRAESRTGGSDRVVTTAGWETAEAVLSVVIPSHGQARYIEAAVESALAAVDVVVEIVVVDDRSPDESAALVRDLMTRHDGRALKLVELADNVGLSEARNRGFREARTPLILLLDADDALLPHGPRALHRALAEDPGAAFAYGLLARFGLRCEDLLGTSSWDPSLFRDGNYIPVTCSLVRRSAWERVGGYTAEGLLELGWEDYDFWLRLADAGERAVQVRRIVGGYRVHGISMSTVTNSHADALMAFLRERHPDLMGHDDT